MNMVFLFTLKAFNALYDLNISFLEYHGVINSVETNKVIKERYLMGQDNTLYKFSIKLSYSSIEQNNSKLQKQISNILI